MQGISLLLLSKSSLHLEYFKQSEIELGNFEQASLAHLISTSNWAKSSSFGFQSKDIHQY